MLTHSPLDVIAHSDVERTRAVRDDIGAVGTVHRTNACYNLSSWAEVREANGAVVEGPRAASSAERRQGILTVSPAGNLVRMPCHFVVARTFGGPSTPQILASRRTCSAQDDTFGFDSTKRRAGSAQKRPEFYARDR